MVNLNGFNASEVDPAVPFEAIPAGKYEVMIVASEEKPTKKRDGTYIELELEVVSGEYKGRKIWDRLNVDNPSDDAIRFAKATLSSICRAVNVLKPMDSTDLHNIPLIAQVKCRKMQDSDDLTNEVKGYFPKDQKASTVQQKMKEAPWAK